MGKHCRGVEVHGFWVLPKTAKSRKARVNSDSANIYKIRKKKFISFPSKCPKVFQPYEAFNAPSMEATVVSSAVWRCYHSG